MQIKMNSSNESLDFPSINDPELPRKIREIRQNILKLSTAAFERKADLNRALLERIEKGTMKRKITESEYKAIKMFAIGYFISTRSVDIKKDFSKMEFPFTSIWNEEYFDPKEPGKPNKFKTKLKAVK